MRHAKIVADIYDYNTAFCYYRCPDCRATFFLLRWSPIALSPSHAHCTNHRASRRSFVPLPSSSPQSNLNDKKETERERGCCKIIRRCNYSTVEVIPPFKFQPCHRSQDFCQILLPLLRFFCQFVILLSNLLICTHSPNRIMWKSDIF